MTFQEYNLQTRRTLPNLDKIYRLDTDNYRNSPLMFPEGTSIIPKNLLEVSHMIIGMFSEIKELSEAEDKQDNVNISEELIDIAWYASNYAYLRSIDISSYQFPGNGIASVTDIAIAISGLSDYGKKYLAYKREIVKDRREAEIEAYFDLLDQIGQFANLYNIDLEQGFQNNIDKLRKRFPEKFDFDLAQEENRDRAAERKELEK